VYRVESVAPEPLAGFPPGADQTTLAAAPTTPKEAGVEVETVDGTARQVMGGGGMVCGIGGFRVPIRPASPAVIRCCNSAAVTVALVAVVWFELTAGTH